jgi:hypothetical protein
VAAVPVTVSVVDVGAVGVPEADEDPPPPHPTKTAVDNNETATTFPKFMNSSLMLTLMVLLFL